MGFKETFQVERTEQQLIEEWERLKALLVLRRTIVTLAAAFFRCIGQYFSRYRGWLEHPGVDPSTINARDDVLLDQAIARHEEFKATVETIYADVRF